MQTKNTKKFRESLAVALVGTILTISAVNDSNNMETKDNSYEEEAAASPSAVAGVFNFEQDAIHSAKIASMAENTIEVVGLSAEEADTIEENVNTILDDSIMSAIYAAPNEEETDENESPIITVVTEYDAYVSSANSINVRSTPDLTSDENKIDKIYGGDTITVIGEVVSTDEKFAKIEYTDNEGNISEAYVSSEYITEKLDESETYNNDWSGKTLNSHNGYTYGPSGKETYYNLNMSRCIYYMNSLGYYGDYWVREDGIKMFGNYVMVASDLSKYPKGTLVETSLGTGIVVDTGEFCHNGSGVALDIAVAW